MQFEDRADAGTRLGQHLVEAGVDADIVLAIPRGGLPVGRAVADALGVPLDIVAAKKIGAPHNPELAIGAVAADGAVWLHRELVQRIGVSDEYIAEQSGQAATLAREKEETYRAAAPDLTGKSVVVVDDGVATGATMTACLRHVRDAGAARVVMAVPVGPPDTVDRLRGEADAVHCLEEPAMFQAVGQFYRRFDQVSDSTARDYLR